VVEHQLPKLIVEGSIPFARSNLFKYLSRIFRDFQKIWHGFGAALKAVQFELPKGLCICDELIKQMMADSGDLRILSGGEKCLRLPAV
jgi:hypothetical protein